MKKILFLVESLDNQTALNLVAAFNHTGHSVDVIPYYHNGINQCVIEYGNHLPVLVYKSQHYPASDYDAALLWCWGTAALGRKYLRLYEDQGVTVVNSSYATEITYSKALLSRRFEENGIPIPPTLYFDKGPSEAFTRLDALGSPPYVFKADYGTQGLAVRFASSIEHVRQFADELNQQHPDNSGFIVQQFIGDAQRPIFHYRVLVVGDEVFPCVMKVTANEPMAVSNIAAGAEVEIVPLTNEVKQLALRATQVSGLKIAGVDLMVDYTDNHPHVVVLEVNDGPGTKTFDREGYNASRAVIDYFIRSITATIEYTVEPSVGVSELRVNNNHC